MNRAIKAMQREVCARYGTVYFPSPASLKVGIAQGVRSADLPLHGLRHPPEGDTSGWYIWAGAFSEAEDFFKPLHLSQIETWKPLALKFLGLPPGWRFRSRQTTRTSGTTSPSGKPTRPGRTS